MARQVISNFVAQVLEQRQFGEHQEYLPSLHTLHNHVDAGHAAAVSFDGRRLGAPLNKQVGPSSWSATSGTTAILTSAAAIFNDQLAGGQALDISLPATLLDTRQGHAQFAAMLRTYYALGGADIQVNVTSVAELCAAQEHPEEYGHFVVRVAGYSELFTRLPQHLQQDLIDRVGAGL